jgi:hypothetical protein
MIDRAKGAFSFGFFEVEVRMFGFFPEYIEEMKARCGLVACRSKAGGDGQQAAQCAEPRTCGELVGSSSTW